MNRTRMTVLVLSIGLANGVLAQPPQDWFLAGSEVQAYTATRSVAEKHAGESSALLVAEGRPGGFGTLMQAVEAGDFAGKRVRFSAYVRTRDVNDWAGLWLRVDGAGTGPLAFDNMQDRGIRGDTDWQAYSIVLDVPQSASALAYGVLLQGGGQVWMDAARLETVDAPVSVHGPARTALLAVPANLDFER